MSPRRKASIVLWLAVAVLLPAAGCRSRVIHVSVTNASPKPISTVIVDYPDATFGVNLLGPGQTFRYVIKLTGAGSIKVQFTDAHGANHTVVGPAVRKGDEGALEISLTQESSAFHR